MNCRFFYPGVQTDAFVVMPNHIHGIVVLESHVSAVGAAPRGRPDDYDYRPESATGRPGDSGQARGSGQARDSGRPRELSGQARDSGQARGPAPTGSCDGGSDMDADGRSLESGRPMTLGDVVHRFKTMTTKRYVDGVNQSGWPRFRGRVWQRNYYEHIIRNESALNRIRRYIEENPLRWASDEHNPWRAT